MRSRFFSENRLTHQLRTLKFDVHRHAGLGAAKAPLFRSPTFQQRPFWANVPVHSSALPTAGLRVRFSSSVEAIQVNRDRGLRRPSRFCQLV